MAVTISSRTSRTRALLQAAALRLMSEQGYDATTVEQIALEAGVRGSADRCASVT